MTQDCRDLTVRGALAAALLLLAACAVETRPVYEQTAGSRAAFALAEAVRGGERGDLPGRARAAGLVEAGVCREVGGGRLYCSALRGTRASVSTDVLAGTPVFSFSVEEMRLCLAPGRAVGFVSEGGRSGPQLQALYREYPEEYASVLQSSLVRISDDPRFSEDVDLTPIRSLTDISVGAALDQLDYGGPSSRFSEFSPGRYIAIRYPPHEPAERACRAL